MEKLKIAEYFDSIVNKIDIFTETKILLNQALNDFYNDRRQKQIELVREIEKKNLLRNDRVKKKINNAGEERDTVEGGFCFVVEFADMLFLAITNRHVSQEEQDLLRLMLRWPNLSYREREKTLSDNYKNGSRGFKSGNVDIDICLDFDFAEFRTSSSLVIDVTQWLDSYFNVQEMKMIFVRKSLRFNPRSITSMFRIKTLRISLSNRILFEKSTLDFVDSVVNCLGRVDNVVLEINFIYKEIVQRFVDVAEVFKSKNNYKLRVNLDTYRVQESIFKEAQLISLVNEIQLKSLSWLSSSKWTSVEKLSISLVSLKELESSDFSSLRSLKILHLQNSTDQVVDIDWSFLDPVRENLQQFYLSTNGLQTLSWKVFRGMLELSVLKISERLLVNVDLDTQGQLFADLQSLQELHLYLNDAITSAKMLLKLPSVEYLSLCLTSDKLIPASFLTGYSMPKLTRLSLRFYGNPIAMNVSCLTSLFKDLPQQLHLFIPDLSVLCSGNFKECTSLKKLSLCVSNFGEVDNEMLIGLDNLVELTLENCYPNPGALSSLQNIHVLRFKDWEQSRDDYTSLVDNLRSLKTIIIDKADLKFDDCRTSENFVYFKNLSMFVLETKFES